MSKQLLHDPCSADRVLCRPGGVTGAADKDSLSRRPPVASAGVVVPALSGSEQRMNVDCWHRGGRGGEGRAAALMSDCYSLIDTFTTSQL